MIDQPKDMQHGLPNCGIVAVAAFLNVPYQLVWDLYRLRFSMSGNWKGRTLDYRRNEMVQACGVETDQFLTALEFGKTVTVKTFAEKHAKPGVLYMAKVGGHILCIRDGWVMDQHASCIAADHPSKRQRVANFICREGQHGKPTQFRLKMTGN